MEAKRKILKTRIYLKATSVFVFCQFLFWIGYNFYFGFNKKPMSDEEIMFDQAFQSLSSAFVLFLSLCIISFVFEIMTFIEDWYNSKPD